ncbi:hypothetical protein MLD38_018686 [Melastoma candidum]|uniref:Uncharacterized protein n=1 Tax=Melastoma candidum TaxID=119954 RepID=A0ACB9QYM0_9MYRT|nr:hypothetical protein MLD38_018686 [Melastoma candidum]
MLSILTLIDLPGLTKVAVEGQPECIVQDIETMVGPMWISLIASYWQFPQLIKTLQLSDAIKLAREVDPSVLKEDLIGLQHPWVGIVNRSQADINKNVDMIVARR